jgi:hypothetical protein
MVQPDPAGKNRATAPVGAGPGGNSYWSKGQYLFVSP